METCNFDPRLTGLLMAWYGQNARDLPWRHTRDPYAIWLSEIMLQQTQVDTVRPYYLRFLAALPSIDALARADEGQVLKLWEGLGYYSRARNLHRCAQAVLQRHGGVFPATWQEVRALPGIGDYTAGAILSIAFGLPTPAVDGNVLRVAARVLGLEADVKAPAVKRAVADGLGAIYPPHGCGDFTQSLMELGATVCVPGEKPRCAVCPVAALCRAKAEGTQARLPVAAPRPAKREEAITVFVLAAGDRLALVRREDTGLLAGMWQLPSLPGALSPSEAREALEAWGLQAAELCGPVARSHTFTHIHWRMGCYYARCRPEVLDWQSAPGFTWADRGQLETEYALPTAFRKCLGGWEAL